LSHKLEVRERPLLCSINQCSVICGSACSLADELIYDKRSVTSKAQSTITGYDIQNKE